MTGENLVLTNCMVYSARQTQHMQQDIYISNGRIVDTRPTHAREVDLKGAFVYSGFVDSHAHLLGTGMVRGSVDLSDARTLEHVELALKHSAPVIIARGWDDSKLSFVPNRAMIDRITDKPAILYRRCGHAAVVNSEAIKRFSLEDLEGVDGSAMKIGLLCERALNALGSRISLARSELKAFIDLGIKEFTSNGITTVHSDDMKGNNDELLVELLAEQRQIRIFEKVRTETLEDIKLFDLAKDNSNNYFVAGALKVYLDGSLGARTAALIEPYSDDPMNCGMLYMDSEQLATIVEAAENKSVQVCAHTIGDRSMEVALNGLARISPGNPFKHRLIHVQTASNIQLVEMKRLDLRASIQPLFYYSDMDIAEQRLGKERLASAYPFKAMEELGIRLSLSSDAPVESTSVFDNLLAADQFFSRANSIRYYTVEGKDLEGRLRYGEIGPGYPADIAVAPVNLLEATREELANAKILMTIVGGHIVFSS
ncbi:MAG TPA: amidohydrolase [Kosmotogaceae bacterium]|nr:MAG: Amidohydrolase 3 [Thermotogales bacterium 46_20]HAA84895.1 amidohydrolase [Kosmotogaceae bacterium]